MARGGFNRLGQVDGMALGGLDRLVGRSMAWPAAVSTDSGRSMARRLACAAGRNCGAELGSAASAQFETTSRWVQSVPPRPSRTTHHTVVTPLSLGVTLFS